MEAANAMTTEQQDQSPPEKVTEENEAAQTNQETADQSVVDAAA